jgi:hypothetical protein
MATSYGYNATKSNRLKDINDILLKGILTNKYSPPIPVILTILNLNSIIKYLQVGYICTVELPTLCIIFQIDVTSKKRVLADLWVNGHRVGELAFANELETYRITNLDIFVMDLLRTPPQSPLPQSPVDGAPAES